MGTNPSLLEVAKSALPLQRFVFVVRDYYVFLHLREELAASASDECELGKGHPVFGDCCRRVP